MSNVNITFLLSDTVRVHTSWGRLTRLRAPPTAFGFQTTKKKYVYTRASHAHRLMSNANSSHRTHQSAAAVAAKASDGAAVGLHAVECEVFLCYALLLHLRQVALAHLHVSQYNISYHIASYHITSHHIILKYYLHNIISYFVSYQVSCTV